MSAAFKKAIREICDFSDSECDLFVPHLKRKQLAKGDFFLQAGEVAHEIAFVESGALRLYYLLDDKEVNQHFFLPSQFAVSYPDFLKQQAGRHFIQALEPCELISFGYEALQMAYAKSKRWERFGRLIAEQIYMESIHRMESMMFLSGAERYRQLEEEHPDWMHRIPLYHLASYLGMERESLSRIRSRSR
ncbi:Crp/Fnr family transcriptional regulator [Pontibacter sp. G13]|uniref:Crp/Fnr family transcriptional regulator n=1 Tax=Pontibacter sp. G13 TaxID=3074898 RepID=UPI00288920E3|nr:Crp/Fnr family transcriptional regulator [Pontibacter sp. G13]WNJ17766.1 Crp/Fnr family transcriptional regulator [Pontibacter sp. G13]